MKIVTDNSKVIENLQKENAELQETIEANLRVHTAAEKADAARIWKLLKENSDLRECLKEATDLECTSRGCLSFRDKTCHGTYDCGIVKKWRACWKEGMMRTIDELGISNPPWEDCNSSEGIGDRNERR